MNNPFNQIMNPPREWSGPTSEDGDLDEADRLMDSIEDQVNRELVRDFILDWLLAKIAPPGLSS